MPSIIKPTGLSVDINAGASSVSDAPLVSIINTAMAPALILDVGSGFNVVLAAGERAFIEKDATSLLDATTAGGSVWATPVAYKA